MFATWLYVSTSTLEENGNDEIASIRSNAQSRNLGLGLTGVLIFPGRHFEHDGKKRLGYMDIFVADIR